MWLESLIEKCSFKVNCQFDCLNQVHECTVKYMICSIEEYQTFWSLNQILLKYGGNRNLQFSGNFCRLFYMIMLCLFTNFSLCLSSQLCDCNYSTWFA